MSSLVFYGQLTCLEALRSTASLAMSLYKACMRATPKGCAFSGGLLECIPRLDGSVVAEVLTSFPGEIGAAIARQRASERAILPLIIADIRFKVHK